MKRITLTAAAFLTAAVFSFAQEIRDIQTTVNLFRNGSAQVIQKWDMTVTQGTEWYIPVSNPGKSYIHDLQVFENGKEYANDGRRWADREYGYVHPCATFPVSDVTLEVPGEYL